MTDGGGRPAFGEAERPSAPPRLDVRRGSDDDEGRTPSSIASRPVGTVPILWEYRDAGSADPPPQAGSILDEIAAAGYVGTQLGRDFPQDDELREALRRRGLRLAEVYAALPASSAGLDPRALAIGRERLRLLRSGGGEVLCVALDGSVERDRVAGRAGDPGTPRLPEAAWRDLARVLEALASEAAETGAILAFHPHAGTFVETPEETARLVENTDHSVGICLDVGHWIVGGGEPSVAIAGLGDRLRHVHLKDVDGAVLARLRDGTLDGLGAAVGQRIFSELGRGILDLDACLRSLDAATYQGWLMVEQDSSWLTPREAASVGRRALAFSMNTLVHDRHTGAISAAPWQTPGAGTGA